LAALDTNGWVDIRDGLEFTAFIALNRGRGGRYAV
jgi:hypothetical protein